MSNLTQLQDNKIMVVAGVNQSTIMSHINTLGQSLAKAWEQSTDVTLGVFAHYMEQQGVKDKGHKGDTTLVTKLAEVLFVNNSSMYRAFSTASGKIVGLKLTVEDVPSGGITVKAEFTKTNRKTVASKFDELMVKLSKSGLKAEYGPEIKAPKSRSNSPGSTDDQDGDVESKSAIDLAIGDKELGKTLAAIAANDADRAALASVQAELAVLLEGLVHMDADSRKSFMFGMKQKMDSVKAKLAASLKAA